MKRRKKLETGMKNLLKELNIDYELSWDEVRAKIENEEEYLAFDSDSERIRVYKVRFCLPSVSLHIKFVFLN